MAGYIRQSSMDIQTGLTVEAAPINKEYNALQGSFSASNGHKHDGSTGEGAPITVVGPSLNVYFNSTAAYPRVTNTVDLGTASLKFKNIYALGTITAGSLATTGVSEALRIQDTFNVNGSAASQQKDGLYVADLGTTVGTTLNPTRTAAIVGQASAGRSVAFTVDGDDYLWGYRSHSDTGLYTFKSKTKLADTWTTARTITVSGGATGSVTLNGSGNVTLPLTITNNSHTHTIANITNLQSTLDSKTNNTVQIVAGDGMSGGGPLTANRTLSVDSTVLRTTGYQEISGQKKFTDLTAPAGSTYRIVSGTGSVFQRTDSGAWYFMLSDSANGGFNDLRPLTINLTTGRVSMAEGLTVTGGISGTLSGNATTATRLETARTIGGVSFNGTANINLPGVNTVGNQNTTGNAATASRWASSRTLTLSGDATGSASMNGSADATLSVSIPTLSTFVNLTGSQTISGIKRYTSSLRVDQFLDFGYGDTTGEAKNISFYSSSSTSNPITARVVVGSTGSSASTYNATFTIQSGAFSWTNVASGNGSGITNLVASNIATGTLSDDRLSSNIPRKDAGVELLSYLTVRGNLILDGTATIRSNVAMNANKITGLADPTATTDVANKRYVDGVASAFQNTGQVGSLCFAYTSSGTSALEYGDTVAGSRLSPSGTYGNSGTLSGTWKCLGYSQNNGGTATLFIRVS